MFHSGVQRTQLKFSPEAEIKPIKLGIIEGFSLRAGRAQDGWSSIITAWGVLYGGGGGKGCTTSILVNNGYVSVFIVLFHPDRRGKELQKSSEAGKDETFPSWLLSSLS